MSNLVKVLNEKGLGGKFTLNQQIIGAELARAAIMDSIDYLTSLDKNNYNDSMWKAIEAKINEETINVSLLSNQIGTLQLALVKAQED